MPPKRKRAVSKANASSTAKARRAREDALADAQGDLASDEDSEAPVAAEEEEEDFFETPDEKRVRLAKEYLTNMGDTRTPEQIQDQLTKQKKTKFSVSNLTLGEPRFLKGHKMAATCVCLNSDEGTMYTGGKDCALIRWDVETGKKDVFPGGRNRFECGGHFEKVLSLCLLEQRGLLVSAGVDRVVRLWDPRSPAKSSCIASLHGHSKDTTALVPDLGEEQFYSGSADKSLKIWHVGSRRCMETLLGHVGAVSSLDLLNKGRPLSGSEDKTVRFWKVDKGTHLMFTRHTYAVDAVCISDQDRFVSGGQDGRLMLWSSTSKKPLATSSLGDGKWVASLSAIKQANVFFSGSVDGALRSWRFGRDEEGEQKGLQLFEAAEPIMAPGCINQIAVGKRLIACAVGKEHKFGRWFYDKKEKNGVLLVPLSYKEG